MSEVDDEQVEMAMFIANESHAEQRDKCGLPYIYHPLRVMARLGEATPEEKAAALMHDVIEDTDVEFDDLRGIFPDEVIDMLDLLTRRDGETHRDYLQRIINSGNVMALRVKLADLHDNANIERANNCPDEKIRQDILGMIKSRYLPAIELVTSELIRLGGSIDIWTGDVDLTFMEETQDEQ